MSSQSDIDTGSDVESTPYLEFQPLVDSPEPIPGSSGYTST